MSDNSWFARFREGLFKDPSGKHRKRMGEAIWLYGYLHICADLETGQFTHTYKRIADETGIPESTVRKMMNRLKKPLPNADDGYIKVRQLSRGLHIQITKWNPPKKEGRVPKSGHSKNGEGAQIRENGCPSMERVPINGHTLNGQNNGSKTSRVPISGHSYKTHIQDPKDIYTVFQFWNDQKITVHREPEKFKSCINARLKHYTAEELCQAIKNYADILNSPDHFFSYCWTLSDFLERKNGIDRFMDRVAAFENFRKNGSPESHPDPSSEETEEERQAKTRAVNQDFERCEKKLGAEIS